MGSPTKARLDGGRGLGSGPGVSGTDPENNEQGEDEGKANGRRQRDEEGHEEKNS